MDDFEIKDGALLKYAGRDRYVVVPEGIAVIGEGAFKDNDSIASLILPPSLTQHHRVFLRISASNLSKRKS